MNMCLQGAPWASMGMQVAVSAWGMEPGQARSIPATEDMDAPKSFAIPGKICGDEVAFWKSHTPQCSGLLLVLFGETVRHGGSNWGWLHVRWEPSPLHYFSGLQVGDFKCGGKGKNGPKGNWAENRTADWDF